MNQMEKARLGAIGENMVISQLLQQGCDAFNANMSIKNFKSMDVVCVNPENLETVFIQVKTSFGKNIPTGFTLENSFTEMLEKKIIGPWIFVNAKGEKENMTFRYFILSKSQVIKLINDSNNWYVNHWHRGERKVSLKNPTGIEVDWLEGKSTSATIKHDTFKNPLNDTTENKWENIWNE